MIFNKVTKNVFQSDEPSAVEVCVETPKWLELGIKAVICTASNVRIPYSYGLSALILPIEDKTLVDEAIFDFAVEFHRKFGPTLVHCKGGLNRSVTFAAALAWSEGQSLEKSWNIMKGDPVFQEMKDSIKRWTEIRNRSKRS